MVDAQAVHSACKCLGSSVVERGTENPCVDSSNLSLGVAKVTSAQWLQKTQYKQPQTAVVDI
jgi:hypothetical protein